MEDFIKFIFSIIVLGFLICYAVVYYGKLCDISEYAPQCLWSRDPMTCAQVVRNGGK